MGSGSTTELTGPNVLIDLIGSQLQYIKIGFVITTILDLDNYPTNNPADFQYSGVYMNYTLYNVAQPIIQSDRAAAGGQNYNYFSLLNVKYQIYGLSSFYIANLPAGVTVVNFNLEFPNPNTVLLQTDNVNSLSQVAVTADQWNSIIDDCTPNVVEQINIRQKYLATVPPIVNSQQNIYETSSAFDFNYFAAGSYDATNPLSNVVLFTNILYFEQITPGMAHEILFSLSWAAGGVPLATG